MLIETVFMFLNKFQNENGVEKHRFSVQMGRKRLKAWLSTPVLVSQHKTGAFVLNIPDISNNIYREPPSSGFQTPGRIWDSRENFFFSLCLCPCFHGDFRCLMDSEPSLVPSPFHPHEIEDEEVQLTHKPTILLELLWCCDSLFVSALSSELVINRFIL